VPPKALVGETTLKEWKAMSRLLVIDDTPRIDSLFAEFFPDHPHWLFFAATAEQARAVFRERRPDAVVLNVPLPDGSGLDLFEELRALDATVPVLVTTAGHSSTVAIEAIKRGAHEYLVKPLDGSQVRELITRALAMRRLMTVPVELAETANAVGDESDVLIGHSAQMQHVYKAIGKVAMKTVTVLIRGETGTGKELTARAIYQHSARAARPFLAINCAAIPEGLLESELFGHERGAFSGADRQRIGKFERCSGGTLFLDEIGDMPPALQSKLLRVLQEQQLQRVGGNETIAIDVRVIAATNRDLEQALADGAFRPDLYYRLNVFSIHLPPLRERREDLPRLVEHLVGRLGRELLQPVQRVAPEVFPILVRYPWPGNVRELQSVLKQAILQTTGPVLMPEHLPAAVREGQPARPLLWVGDRSRWAEFVADGLTAQSPGLYAKALELMERTVIPLVLQHTLGNQTAAAELLGITRASLRFKIRTLGIDVEQASRTGEGRPTDGACNRAGDSSRRPGARTGAAAARC
jgi:two-component system nitrogen regulation response regulator GlnG